MRCPGHWPGETQQQSVSRHINFQAQRARGEMTTAAA
jgi:hypothetical protein